MMQVTDEPVLPKNGLWSAWCKKCCTMRQFGQVYRDIGWPFCGECNTLFEWIPPHNDDGILRTWDENPVR